MPTEILLAADDGSNSDSLDAYIEGFLDDLWALGFAERRMPRRRRTVESFALWVRCAQIPVADLSEAHAALFVEPLRSPTRLARTRGVLRRLLQYLDRKGVLKPPIGPAATPEDQLLRAYLRFLRQDQGLCQNTVKLYRYTVCAFLAERAAEAGAALVETIDARTVRAHLLARTRTGSPRKARLIATSLRYKVVVPRIRSSPAHAGRPSVRTLCSDWSVVTPPRPAKRVLPSLRKGSLLTRSVIPPR